MASSQTEIQLPNICIAKTVTKVWKCHIYACNVMCNTYTCVCMHACTRTHARTHAHTHTHTHTYTLTESNFKKACWPVAGEAGQNFLLAIVPI